MTVKVAFESHITEATRKIKDEAEKRMHEAVNEVRNNVNETLSGSRSGRQYKVPGTNRVYTASAPGEPPAQATSTLRKGIKTVVENKDNQITGMVGTDSSYGPSLEFGTSKMEARPWLNVSFVKSLEALKRIFGDKWLP